MKELYQNTMIWPGERLSGRKNTFKDEEQIEYLLELHQRQARNPMTYGGTLL